MITITNNQEGKENVKIEVSKGAYESFYKRLGYSIVEENKREVAKKATPKSNIESEAFENTTIDEALENKEEKKVSSRRKTITNE